MSQWKRKNLYHVLLYLFGVFLKQRLSNYPLTIVGSGKQKRDFLYISDVCEAFFKAAISKYKCEIFNLGKGHAESVNYLSSLISIFLDDAWIHTDFLRWLWMFSLFVSLLCEKFWALKSALASTPQMPGWGLETLPRGSGGGLEPSQGLEKLCFYMYTSVDPHI